MDKAKQKSLEAILDALKSINIFAIMGVIGGIAVTHPRQRSLDDSMDCQAGAQVAKDVIIFQVVAFFLLSASLLIVVSLKLAITLQAVNDVGEGRFKTMTLRMWMVAAILTSVVGASLVFLALFDILQLYGGNWSCSSKPAIRATSTMGVILAPILLLTVFGLGSLFSYI